MGEKDNGWLGCEESKFRNRGKDTRLSGYQFILLPTLVSAGILLPRLHPKSL